MRRPLLDVIFSSGKRKDVLLLLKEGPKKTDTILKLLETTRTALLPQIKILEDHYLVDHHKDIYELTAIGKLLVEKMVPLLDTVEVFDADIDYWGTHDLDFLPSHLLKRINELGNYSLVIPDLSDIYVPPQEMYGEFGKISKTSNVSRSFIGVTAFFYPDFKSSLSEMIDNNVNIHLIVTKNMHGKIQNHEFADLKEIAMSDLFHLHVYPENIGLMSFGFTDRCLILRLLNIKKEYDSRYILSFDQCALQWAKDLYEYYKKDSVSVN